MDNSFVLTGGKAECVGTWSSGKNLWRLSFLYLGSLSAVGGMTSTQGRGAVERCNSQGSVGE